MAQAAPKRRKRLRARSPSKADPEAVLADTAVRESVFDRDGHRCQFPHGARWPLTEGKPSAHGGRLTAHHLRKSGQGGAYEKPNLLSLCQVSNDWVEDHPALAMELGLSVAKGITPEEAQIRRLAWGCSW